jgi:hypothetical protein
LGQRINTRLRAGGNAGGIAFDFRTGALDPRITFTRASAAWYFDHNGNLNQAATNEPRFDFAPSARIQTYSYTIPAGDFTNIFIVPVGKNGIITETIFVNGAPVTPILKDDGLQPGVQTWFTLPTTYFGGTVFRIEYTGYDPVGLLIEGGMTNIALHSRDLTQAAWVKTNINVILSATGIDGVSSTASRLTATAANGTVLQTITSASATHISSFFARRLDGTGTVEITQDNGATWTAITLTDGWQRFNVAAATVVNPVIGFRLVTSGDVIAVDVAQCEVSGIVSSPIITGAASITRAADLASITTLSPWFNANEGTILAEYQRPFVAFNQFEVNFSNGTFSEFIGLYTTAVSQIAEIRQGGASQAGLILEVGAGVNGRLNKKALAYRVNDFAASFNGSAPIVDISGVVPTALTTMRIGTFLGSSQFCGGWIRRIAYYPTRLPDTTLQGLTA